MRKGYLTPSVITVLAAIILFVALVFFLIADFAKSVKKQRTPTPSPSSTTQAQPTPSPEETVDWMKYTSTDLGFILKYPPIVTTSNVSYSSGSGGWNILGLIDSSQKDHLGFMAIWAKGLKESDLDQAIKNDQESVNETGGLGINAVVNCNIEDYLLGNNVQALRKTCDFTRQWFIYFKNKDSKVVRITTTAEGPKRDKYEELVDQILSTFKFLD